MAPAHLVADPAPQGVGAVDDVQGAVAEAANKVLRQ